MEYSAWPTYIQRRYGIKKIELGKGKTGSYKPDPATENITANEAIEWIYAVLTTLDSKASALMRLNGVQIAAAAFLLGLFGRQGTSILSTTRCDALLIVGCALLSALSIGVCLFVVNVSWPFLGKVEQHADGTIKCSEEILALEKARNFRQRMYRFAWFLSLAASAAFLVEFLAQTYMVLHGTSLFGAWQ
jgi:hypothetical protein